MVIPVPLASFRKGETGQGREGIRCRTGAVPATVIAFCAQRTDTSLKYAFGKTRCQAKARKPAILQDKNHPRDKDGENSLTQPSPNERQKN